MTPSSSSSQRPASAAVWTTGVSSRPSSCSREALDARLRGVDALAERVEGRGDDLAVEDVAAGGKRGGDVGEVAGQRLAVAGLQLDVVAVDEDDRPEAVPLWLIGPPVALGQRGAGPRELGEERGLERERHDRVSLEEG